MAVAGLTTMIMGGACGGETDEPAATPTPGPTGPAAVACTRASCLGGADVTLRGVPGRTASVEACVDGHCEVVRAPVPESVRVPLPAQGRSGGPSVRFARATAEARDREGTALARGSSEVRLQAVRPNGRRCTPTCWTGESTLRLRRKG